MNLRTLLRRVGSISALAVGMVGFFVPVVVAAQTMSVVSGPTYASIECSKSDKTGRVRGAIQVLCPSQATCTESFALQLPKCGQDFDNAEIYLKGWKLHHVSDTHQESLLHLSTTKQAFDPASGIFEWELKVGTLTAQPDETAYLLTFEILQTTDSESELALVQNSCQGPAKSMCSSSAPVPTLAHPPVSIGLSSSHLSSAGGAFIELTQVAAILSGVTAAGTNDLGCAFWGFPAVGFGCETSAVVIAASTAEASWDQIDRSTSGAMSSSEDFISNGDMLKPNFRLCAHKAFELTKDDLKLHSPIWGLWAGADETDPHCGGFVGLYGGFNGTWLYFFGGDYHPAANMFLNGMGSGDPFYGHAQIGSALFW